MKTVVPKLLGEWNEVAQELDKIRKTLLSATDVHDKDFYYKLLDQATGHYMFITPLYKKFRAIKTNNEMAYYNEQKENAAESNDKFVDAVAKKIASHKVAKERYLRDWFDGQMLIAEQAINTCKKHLGTDLQEGRLSTNIK